MSHGRGRPWRVGVALAAAAMAASGCRTMPPLTQPIGEPPALLEVEPEAWPLLEDDLDAAGIEAACFHALAALDAGPSDRRYRFGELERTAGELAEGVRMGCRILLEEKDPARRAAKLAEHFLLLRSSGRDGTGEVLVTGYYEPLIQARRHREPPFVHPVLGEPPDLLTVDWRAFGLPDPGRPLMGRLEGRRVAPYPDRDAIDHQGAVPEGTPVLGWVADPVDVFFLQVQGSGTLELEDGERLRAGFSATNGHPYVSIGRLLIDEGQVSREGMSMQAIRAWLAEHPEQRRRVLGANPSYVFFRPLAAVDGPLGCYGVPVTAGRSIATDRRLFQAPVLAWLRGSLPGPGGRPQPFARFVLNQDTGGAIRGPGRVDLFVGAGPEAGEVAGRLAHRGELFFLLPRVEQADGSP